MSGLSVDLDLVAKNGEREGADLAPRAEIAGAATAAEVGPKTKVHQQRK